MWLWRGTVKPFLKYIRAIISFSPVTIFRFIEGFTSSTGTVAQLTFLSMARVCFQTIPNLGNQLYISRIALGPKSLSLLSLAGGTKPGRGYSKYFEHR